MVGSVTNPWQANSVPLDHDLYMVRCREVGKKGGFGGASPGIVELAPPPNCVIHWGTGSKAVII